MLETMTFGKYKGQLVSLVPTNYLIWCVEYMAIPPKIVVAELERRAGRHGTRDAIEAACAVSGVAFKQAQTKKKRGAKKAKKRKQPKASRQEKRAQRQREQAASRLERAQAEPVVGEDYDRLRLAYAQAGGDEDACPFATEAEPYEGPEMYYQGGQWNIAPDEFPDCRY